jgi:hypothetical protein
MRTWNSTPEFWKKKKSPQKKKPKNTTTKEG